MCGVVGALAYGEFETKKQEKDRQESMIFLVSEILQLTQSRGKDATGIATLFANCDYMGLKMGISAQEFVARFGGTEKDYDGYLNVWRKKKHPAKIVIGHCRKPSAGGGASADDNKNNHPIKVGDIVGVHNGTLTNHEQIFTNLGCGRDAHVDSEAIFRLLHHYTDNGNEPFTTEGVLETCKRLDGSYACLAFSGNNPYQMAAFRDGRPLEACIIRPLKMVLIASDKDFLKAAIFRYNKMANLYQTGASKFVPLKKNDVDLEVLTDDSLYLFDVHGEITPETNIKDLYVSEKVPRLEKIWKKPSVATTNWNARNRAAAQKPANNNTPGDGVKKAEVNASSPGTRTDQDSGTDNKPAQGKRLGMAWNSSGNRYESISDVDETDRHGSVEIDIEKGEVRDLTSDEVIETGEKKPDTSTSSNDDSGLPLNESDEPVDNLITDPAKINEIAVAEIEKQQHADSSDDSGNKAATGHAGDKQLPDDVKASKKEVELGTYPDVVEKAQIATTEEPSFSNDNELGDAIEVKNHESMKNMALYSLANRIKAYFFRRGWYAGYICRLKEEGAGLTNNDLARQMLVRARNKANKAQGTIRIMKTMVKIFDRIVVQFPNGSTDDQKIDRAVTETLEKGEDVKSATITQVFREGDMKKHPILRRVTASVANKEDR